MFPFDLTGPEFLVFYLIVGVSVEMAVLLTRHLGEPEGMPKVNLSDPYLIAYLRGGHAEVLRVVTMALIDRGILVASDKTITAADGAFGKAAPGVEQKVVKNFNPSADAVSIFKMTDVEAEMDRYKEELIKLGLLTSDEMKKARLSRMWLAIGVLFAIAITKLVVALSTGHTNVQYLIFLAILFSIVVGLSSRARLTKAGENMLESLRTLFGGLKSGSSATGMEFALAAAVFGTATIPSGKKLFPQVGSSGCGSSSGDGDGGDGGGDGGGGGCGGCGGG